MAADTVAGAFDRASREAALARFFEQSVKRLVLK
jgi:hypothetical protein